MNDLSPAHSSLIETLGRRIVIIDGAMGTMIQTTVARNSRIMGGTCASATTF
jgi:methionine synthase I (cobalamin-dependent)